MWRELPDYASANLSEPDAPVVMELLRGRGVGVEAGLASVADANRFVKLAHCDRVLRILIEIEEPKLLLSPARERDRRRADQQGCGAPSYCTGGCHCWSVG
jgi:uncharacterized protein (DUF849 family)